MTLLEKHEDNIKEIRKFVAQINYQTEILDIILKINVLKSSDKDIRDLTNELTMYLTSFSRSIKEHLELIRVELDFYNKESKYLDTLVARELMVLLDLHEYQYVVDNFMIIMLMKKLEIDSLVRKRKK